MKRIETSGVTIRTFDEPPQGFKPSSVNHATLQQHGIPVGKNDTENAMISGVLTRLGSSVRFVPPEFEVRPPRTGLVRRGKGKKATEVIESERSQNWAGVVLYAPLGESFRYVTTEFTVPDVAQDKGGSTQYSSHWVGLDGYTEDPAGKQLCQAGVECDSSATKGATKPYLWAEWVPGPLIVVSNPSFTLTPGDLLGITLCTTGPGATTATVSFVNLTTGVVMNAFQFSAPQGYALVGETAEWISERPSDASNGVPLPLAKFGQNVFCAAVAGTTKGTTVQAAASGLLEMQRSATDNTLLCETTVPGDGTIRTLFMQST